MADPITRQALLDAGCVLAERRGYHGMALSDVLATSGATKGSFYHCFESKEEFCVGVIEEGHRRNLQLLRRHLASNVRSPLQRLRAYFEADIAQMAELNWSGGCLLGNIGQEIADHSELLRTTLERLFAEWREEVAACLRDAQAAGELSAAYSPVTLASVCLASWEGALLLMKVEKSGAPLERFLDLFFEGMFAGSAPATVARRRERRPER